MVRNERFTVKYVALTGLVALLLAGCEQEVIHHDSSLASQLAKLNRDGWAIDDRSKPATPGIAGDPNVHVIKEADFSGYHFDTNFQVDDPALREQLRRQHERAVMPPTGSPPSPPPTQ
jgi:hypothetical protein